MSEFYFCDKLSKDHFKKVINTIQVLKEKNSIESLQKEFSDCCESDGLDIDTNKNLTQSEKSACTNSSTIHENNSKCGFKNNTKNQRQSDCCSQQYQNQFSNSIPQNNCCSNARQQKNCHQQQPNYQPINLPNNTKSQHPPGNYHGRVPIQPASVYHYTPSPSYQQVTFVPVHQSYSANFVNPPNQYYSPMTISTNTPMSITPNTPMTISSNTPTNIYVPSQPKPARTNVHYHNSMGCCDCNKLILPRK